LDYIKQSCYLNADQSIYANTIFLAKLYEVRENLCRFSRAQRPTSICFIITSLKDLQLFKFNVKLFSATIFFSFESDTIDVSF
jgi:hypothetical protein